MSAGLAKEQDRVTADAKVARHRHRHVGKQADHPDGRRRIDRTCRILVVQRDVPASDRCPERPTRIANAATRLDELKVDIRLLGIPEVEAVGDTKRPGTGAGDVAGRFGDGTHAALIRVEQNVTRVAVHRHGDAETRARNLHYAGVAPRGHDAAGAYGPVILLKHPALACDRWCVEESLQRVGKIPGVGRRGQRTARPGDIGFLGRRGIHRTAVHQLLPGNRRDDATVVHDAEDAIVRDLADRRCIEVPLLAHRADLIHAMRLGDDQHPLLRFREHDFVRCHPGLAGWHLAGIHLHADAASRRHLRR